MAIGDYTSNVQAIEDDEKNEKADLKLSQETSEAWITPMTNFHLALESVRDSTNGLDAVPGGIPKLKSAEDTRENLARAVTGFGGVQPALEDHMKYQGELAKAVKSAHDLLLNSG